MSTIVVNKKEAMIEARSALATAKIVALFEDTGENRKAIYKIMEKCFGDLIDDIEQVTSTGTLEPRELRASKVTRSPLQMMEKIPTTRDKMDRIKEIIRGEAFDPETGEKIDAADYDPFGSENAEENEKIAIAILENKPLEDKTHNPFIAEKPKKKRNLLGFGDKK